MSGFNNLEQELDSLRNEGLPVSSEMEQVVQNYQRQAEEIEQALLNEQANERQSAIEQEESVKHR